MAIVYCSWATGDDTTGDGTAANPFKTITKASTSRSPGDEVRVAKSAEPTALTGTVGFTLNSTTVTGVDTAFTSELAIGDFIQAPDGQYYEVITLTSDTAAVLYKRYPGETQSGYSSYKLGVTDTGAAAGSSTQMQVVSSSGDSSAYLYISGGWDLSTELQTGQTYFRQMHATFANRYGYGLYISDRSYTNISRLHFLRYNIGIKFYMGSTYNILTSLVCSSNQSGIAIEGNMRTPHYNTIASPVCNSNNGAGITMVSISVIQDIIITNAICNSNGVGINITSTDNCVLTSPVCNSNATGIAYNSGAINSICTGATCNNNSGDGITYGTVIKNTLISPVCYSNGSSGIAYSQSNNNICSGAICNSNKKYGIYYTTYANRNSLISPTCSFNTYTGIYYYAAYSNSCISPTCNSNGYHGVSYSSGFSNTLFSPTCNSNTYQGIIYSASSNNTCTSPTCTLNGRYGFYFTEANNNFIYGMLSTTGNIDGAIFSEKGSRIYINKASIAESTIATGFTAYEDGRVYINNMGGQSYIYTDYGNIVSQDATAGGTGKEWKFSPTSAGRNSRYPLTLPIAKFAVASSGQVTVTVYFKKSGTGVAGALLCRYGQVEWSDASEDIIVNCPDDTARNQVTLQFTPTEAGVVEIEAGAWYVSATDQTVIIDDIEISQA